MPPFNKPTAPAAVSDAKDVADVLDKIVHIVENFPAIRDAHAQIRQELRLTADQQSQYDEAKQYIAQYQELLAEHTEKETNLQHAMDMHAEDIETFSTWRKEEVARLEAKAEEQAAKEKEFDARTVAILEMKQAVIDGHEKVQAEIDRNAAKNEKDAQANATLAEELAALKDKLERKSKRLHDTLADED